MRNIFVRTYLSFALLILVSFSFAGAVFMTQVSRYYMQENYFGKNTECYR